MAKLLDKNYRDEVTVEFMSDQVDHTSLNGKAIHWYSSREALELYNILKKVFNESGTD